MSELREQRTMFEEGGEGIKLDEKPLGGTYESL